MDKQVMGIAVSLSLNFPILLLVRIPPPPPPSGNVIIHRNRPPPILSPPSPLLPSPPPPTPLQGSASVKPGASSEMDVNSCLLAFLLIHALLFSSQSDLAVQAAESVSGSFSDPFPSHDLYKLKVVSKRTQRPPLPSPMIHAPYHFKSPPPFPPQPCPPSPPPPPPSSLWQPPL
ncbi:extensin-like [Herrania umbratica]|uniref:Extensin-like n=1 Tax=Herrania umbratica TaxID=108875 RepID=A0A6J1A7P4_9ROSI|nr:extensin-like [Herrania umbratica]